MDYFVDNSRIFKTELAGIEEKINSLKKERKFAINHNIGLDGPILATTKEISLLQSEVSDLKKKISIVDQGFTFFEKHGFGRALDACGMVYGVETLSQDLNVDVIGFKDTQVRVPIDVQKKYLSAVKLKLFDLFLIYWAFEPEEDETIAPREVDYYLFGSVGPETSIDIFLIGQWSTKLEN
ncbi:unnamed protein product [marine sediment metagenome]|uniref:Uncharacterized protein n=1 Tax=marine sediment metagenome TaxID=412755 RepID=X1RWK5_9ZZZZ